MLNGLPEWKGGSAVEQLPTRARVVVIGGGVIGCSVAYHLASLGVSDVVVLEQAQLSSGTTWHAAGIIGQMRPTSSMTRLARHSIDLYSRLEAETGFATGWRQCGALWVARDPERVTHLRRAISQAAAFGTQSELISPDEAGRRFPLLNTDDLLAAVWLPEDGTANPTDLTQALARGASAQGVKIFERTKVLSLDVKNGEVSGVTTAAGTIECDQVVLAAGQWSKAIGDSVGAAVPLFPAQHFYVVTEPIEGIDASTPILRDPDGFVYFKPEVGGLIAGSFEPDALPWVPSKDIPDPFEFKLLDENWDHFAPSLGNAAHRVPALETAGLRKLYNGPESFTPDNNFLLGETPEVRGLFVAAGFNSGGIANAGGAGLALAEWMVEGEPTRDLWSVDIRRFAPYTRSDRWLRRRTIETLGAHYSLPFPNREMDSGRGLRRSPVHHLLDAAGACFGSKLGWERTNWFAEHGQAPIVDYSFDRQNWHDNVAAEHRATRERVAIFDQTSFAKFVMSGSDAEDVLQYLCANDVAVPVGKVVYTALLNDRGGFESDLTITRTGIDEFLIVTGSGQQTRDFSYLQRNIPAGKNVSLVDVTAAYAVFSVMGPQSRALLSSVSAADFSVKAFKFGTSQLIDLGDAQVRATRMTYVGELGWELYVPSEFAVHVYEVLMEAGVDFGLRHAGYYAIDGLRLEKGFRAWGRELTPEIDPLEAGLAQFCKLDTEIPFRGRIALEKKRDAPLEQRLVDFRLRDADAQLWGGEVLVKGDEIVGTVTSAAFGHTVGSIVGTGWVTKGSADWGAGAFEDLQVDVGGKRFAIYPLKDEA